MQPFYGSLSMAAFLCHGSHSLAAAFHRKRLCRGQPTVDLSAFAELSKRLDGTMHKFSIADNAPVVPGTSACTITEPTFGLRTSNSCR